MNKQIKLLFVGIILVSSLQTGERQILSYGKTTNELEKKVRESVLTICKFNPQEEFDEKFFTNFCGIGVASLFGLMALSNYAHEQSYFNLFSVGFCPFAGYCIGYANSKSDLSPTAKKIRTEMVTLKKTEEFMNNKNQGDYIYEDRKPLQRLIQTGLENGNFTYWTPYIGSIVEQRENFEVEKFSKDTDYFGEAN